MAFTVPSIIASGNIPPRRMVKGSGTNTGALATDPTTDNVIGVSQDTTRRFDSAYAAIEGDVIPLQYPHDGVFRIDVGSGGVTAFKHVEPDSNGKAITALFTAETNRAHPFVALETIATGVARCILATARTYIPQANTGISGGG